ncbi:MAG: alanyl-tRNA editing protein [Lachnospiraceae bacterium]
MLTRRLFEENVKTQRFEARVLSCTEEKGKYHIELDATAFFPEGGGQPGDQGELFPGLKEDGEPVKVLDTREKAGVIFHVTDKAILEGTEVLGRLNWDKRLRNMQNHSGEHILSGLIHAKYGYNNVGFHMGSDAVTLDLDGVIAPEELPEFERQVNEAIEKNLEIEVFYPTREELEHIDYRSKKEIEGQVRIVRIGDYDTCACCGTHVERTGEIRLIKLLGLQNYKGGVRISMLTGKDAIDDYEKKHATIQEATHLLSVKPDQVDSGIRKLLEANAALKSKLIAFQRQIGEEKANAVLEGTKKVCFLEPNFQNDELREMCNKAAVKAELVLGLLPIREGMCQYVLVSTRKDVREAGKELNSRFQGKGGGQPSMVQGTLMADGEEIRSFFLDTLNAE